MLIDGARLDAPAAPLDDLLRTGLGRSPEEVAIVSSHRALSWPSSRTRARASPPVPRPGLEPGDRSPR